jgi:hypothetical protein
MRDRISYDDLREFEPFDWPGRDIVEQDNMGDWGGWLSDFEDGHSSPLGKPETRSIEGGQDRGRTAR